jgi:predicted ribosomally synthesized peptide with nif11-like leader
MSTKSFGAFRERLATDGALRDEMSRVLGSDGSPEALVAFAKARGYDVDLGEVKSAFEQLSDEELDAVAGGTAKLMLACASGQHFKEAVITNRG